MLNRPPILGPIVTLEGEILQTVADFTRNNKLNIRKYELWSDNKPQMAIAHAPMIFSVDPEKAGSPSGYAINISTPKGFIKLPAGGSLWISHRTGRITAISSTMPLRTVSFEEAMALARQIEDNITALGIKANVAYHDMTEEKLLEQWRHSRSNNIYATWGVEDRIKIRIKPFSGYSQVAFISPIGIPNRERPETYLVQFTMYLHSPAEKEVSELATARAIDITGEKEGEFPVRIWFEQPNWRPHGWKGQWIK